jgi:hypothetical protein
MANRKTHDFSFSFSFLSKINNNNNLKKIELMIFLFLFYQIIIIIHFLYIKNSGWCTDHLHHHSVKVAVAIHSITQGKGVMILSAHDSSRGQFVFEWQCLLIVLCSCRYWFLFSPFFLSCWEILKKWSKFLTSMSNLTSKGIPETTRQQKPVCHHHGLSPSPLPPPKCILHNCPSYVKIN